ncbi:hypothetical protein CXF68_11840 [Tenacibaculum sp. Bg11-29]|uniref:hypothetical protein n=1 Tax=Tenacibaculum sp. Bg11-29 TaxID=2058306 RepID=UPI000C34BAF3|nr:hypothetical protein [Tenacibaculum sp. Bg11-29]PKH51331.1 hypothetical protein CXF68_11840 [Tenacibaculum sp. Bg11-29]
MNKTTKNSTDYINKKMGKKTGFSTPDSYFNKVDDRILSMIKPTSLSKGINIFSTPDNYFTTVEDDIFEKLNIKKTKNIKVISLRKRILQFVPLIAAASVLLFISLNYLNTSTTYDFEDITEADITFWYENGYGSADSNELATVIDNSDFDEAFLTTINDESIESYLNTMDNSILINEIQ